MKQLFLFIIFPAFILSCSKNRAADYKSFGASLQKSFIWKREPDSITIKPHSVGFRKEFEIKRLPGEAKIMILLTAGKYYG